MKKCQRCQITFADDSRVRCLYCDSPLSSARLDDLFQSTEDASVREKFFKEQAEKSRERIQYLVGSYFRAKSFSFMYALDRNEWIRGRGFKRFLIQPVDFAYILKLPWLIVNILDSIISFLIYRGYCENCGWKVIKISSEPFHDAEECEYNREYAAVLGAILNGNIIRSEKDFKQLSEKKVVTKRKSAYYELCSKRRDFEVFLDMIVIFMSFGLLVYILIKLTLPIFAKIYNF